MKLLLVTCRNIDKNGGENALIMGRHISLYNEYSVETDIIFFHKDTEVYGDVSYPGINFIHCKKENIYQKLDALIESGEYQGIVVSGFYDKKFTEYIEDKKNKYHFIYIVDIHATIKEIYEYCIPDLYHILGTRYLYIKKKIRFIQTLKIVDFAFVVSDEEIREINHFLPNNNIKFVKIRCGCYNPVEIDKYFVYRKEQRKKMNISEDTLAFVYSGSKDRWQKFEDTIDLYKKIQLTGVKCKFAFYMNLDEASKKDLYSILGKENVIIRWVSPEEMKKELTAYDVGVMLRDYKWTNRVAFPNKFSDYIASGLNLVLSKAVVDPYKIAKEYNIRLFDPTDIRNEILKIQEIRQKKLVDYIKICQKLVDEELLYSKQVRKNSVELIKEMKQIRNTVKSNV